MIAAEKTEEESKRKFKKIKESKSSSAPLAASTAGKNPVSDLKTEQVPRQNERQHKSKENIPSQKPRTMEREKERVQVVKKEPLEAASIGTSDQDSRDGVNYSTPNTKYKTLRH